MRHRYVHRLDLLMEDAMRTLELCLLSLLRDDKVLTISKTDDGWLITHSDVEVEGSEIYFVPNVILSSTGSLAEAISSFDAQQSMSAVRGYQA